ncbi:MAG: hypothetical protein AAFQ94_27425 [Bacteroidota bacterium]
MKTITIFLMCMMSLTVFAQSPQKFNYQALAQDSTGNPIANQSISIRLSILSGSANGTSIYSEAHNSITDGNGVFSLEIGDGTALIGTFDQIDWGSASFFLKTEIDVSGGSTYDLLGISQLLSVPYALYSNQVSGVELANNHQIQAGQSSNISIGNIQPNDPAAIGNNIIGHNAGSATMSGPYNVLIGQQAGKLLTTGSRNTFIGSFAGDKNTTGGYNVFIGTDTGRDNETGTSNTLVGNQAGTRMTGSLNTAVGRWAGHNNFTGRNNVFMGVNAGAHNNGFGNVMIGSSTGWQATGSKNVFLGQGIGEFANTHSSVLIGYQVGENVSSNNIFILGNGPDSTNHLITGDFVSGDVAVRGELTAGSGIRFADGSILNSASSQTTIDGITIEPSNTIVGSNAGASNSGLFNSFFGSNSGNVTTGNENTFVGFNAGLYNTSGDANTFLGQSAGRENTTGRANVFLGWLAGRFNTEGSGNVYVGPRAAQSATNASFNTFIGNNAGAAITTGPSNTMVGALAGREQTTATENTYLGYFAARNATSGSKNTAIGSYAGMNANGERNVFIGYEAGHDSSGDDQLIIANGRDSTDVLLRGDFVTGNLETRGILNTAGGIRFADGTLQTTAWEENINWTKNIESNIHTGARVGIGTTTPFSALHIKHPSIGYRPGGLTMENSNSTSVYTWINSGDHLFLGFNNDSGNGFPSNGYQNRIFLQSDGNLGVGTITPSEKLSVAGKIETTEGIKFADGTVQTTAAETNTVQSKLEYYNFNGYSVITENNWQQFQSRSITVPGPGKIAVTYTGYSIVNISNTAFFAIGLNNSLSPVNATLTISGGPQSGFTLQYVHSVSSAGTYTFSLLGRHSFRTPSLTAKLSDVKLLYIPD